MAVEDPEGGAVVHRIGADRARPLPYRPRQVGVDGRLRVAILGEDVPMSLRRLIGSTPGFAAPLSAEHPSQLRGFRGAAVVVRSAAPDRAVNALLDQCAGCPPILVLTEVRDTDIAIEALRRGATSYLVTAECLRDEFMFSLLGTVDGRSSTSPSVTTALVRRVHLLWGRAGDDPADPLTPRDVTILSLVAEGCTNMQIATRLCLAEKTVRNAVSRLYGKIEVGSRAEAIVWWLHRHAV